MTIRLKNWQRLALLGIAALLVVGVGTQLRPPKVFRIGVLNIDQPLEEVFDGLKLGMTELNYVEGQTIEYIYSGPANGNVEQLAAEAADLVAAKVDLILAIGTPATAAAQAATTEIPIVFWVLNDPVAEHFVTEMRSPGGNMTGVTIGIEGTASEGRRLELLTQISPDIQQVYIPYNSDNPNVVNQGLAAVQEAASSLGIDLILHEVHTPEDAAASAQNIPDDADAIFILYVDRLVMTARLDFIASALEHHLPLSMFRSEDAQQGALITFGTRFIPIGEQAARIADQILKGAQAGQLPVEIPEFFLTVNLQTAAAIGLEVPDTLIRQADIVVR